MQAQHLSIDCQPHPSNSGGGANADLVKSIAFDWSVL